MKDNTALRQTFDQVALLYHEARPCYPDALIASLLQVTALPPAAKLLEIGPGTGQATKALALHGFHITGVELGPALAAVAQAQLADFPNVRILTGAFEEVPLPADTFDLVFAATSFHWINPESRYAKPYRILKPEGYLAITHTHHISDQQGDEFFKTSQPIYDRYHFTDTTQPPLLPPPDSIQPTPIEETLFKLTHFQGFPIVITYRAKAFVNLLNTFSNHLMASKQIREDFLGEIENLINEKFGGSIEKHFLMSLTVAQKKSLGNKCLCDHF